MQALNIAVDFHIGEHLWLVSSRPMYKLIINKILLGKVSHEIRMH